MEAPWVTRTFGARLGRRLTLAAAIAVLGFGAGCGEGSPGSIAARILSRYQKASGAKPLTAGGMIRLRLAAEGMPPGEGSGTAEILWEPGRERPPVVLDIHPVAVFPIIQDWIGNKLYKEVGVKIPYDLFCGDSNRPAHKKFSIWVVPLFRL